MPPTSSIEELRSAVSDAYLTADTLQMAYEERAELYDSKDLLCRRWQDESPRPDGTATGELIYRQAHAALEVAREMQKFNRKSIEEWGQHPIASWLTLRPVLEASLRAYWVLAPVAYRIDEASADGKKGDGRVERAARWARDSLKEGRTFARLFDDGETVASFDRDIAALDQQVSDRGLPPIKNKVATVAMATELPDPALAHAAEAYWRLISGLDHGDETAQRTAWIRDGESRVRSDEYLFLGACLNITRVRILALRRFLELME